MKCLGFDDMHSFFCDQYSLQEGSRDLLAGNHPPALRQKRAGDLV